MEKIKYLFKEFLPEVRGEWNKVTKPGSREVLQTTVVVVVTSVVFAVFLWLADLAIQQIYERTFQLLGL